MIHIKRIRPVIISDNTFFVAKTGSDYNTGNAGDPYLTIQKAIDAIIDKGILGTGQYATVNISPGWYTEKVCSYQGIFLVGLQNIPTTDGGTVTIYNTGADTDHYPLSSSDGCDFWLKDITIQTDNGGVFGQLSNSRFNSVRFVGGEFIERTEDKQLYSVWKNCSFLNCNAFNLTGVASQGRYMVFEQCWFGWWKTMRFESTHTVGNAVFDFDGGHIAFTKLSLKGDWYHFAKNYHSFGAYRHEFDTTKGLSFRNVTISNGVHFISDPMSFQMIGCEMDDAAEMPIPADEADITADVPITDCLFVDNAMHNGLSGNIQIRNPVRNVGTDAVNRYFSIQDAIDSFHDGGVISLQPGTYTEQIHSTADIRIQGLTHEGVPAVKATVLYNTGADAEHYPLGGDDTDHFVISDITIKTEPGGVIGKLSTSEFTGVVFQNGHFVEATANQPAFLGLSKCSFKDSMAFNLTGVGAGGMRAMTIIGCYFGDHTTHSVFDSTNTVTLVIIKDTVFHNFYPDIGGDWVAEVSNSHVFGTERTVVSTTGKISYIQCILSNGLHFTANPDTCIIQLCTFNDGCGYPITGEDITSTIDITGIDYAHNVQQNGLSGKIQTLCPVKNVGCHATDRYYTIQDALTSIPTDGIATIRIWQNFTDLAELTMPNTGTHITINGSKKYSLAFTGDVVEITGSQYFGFIDMVKVTGGNIRLNGSTAEVQFDSNQDIAAYLTVDVGSLTTINLTQINAPTGKAAITINTIVTPVVIGYSKIKGATDNAAILFGADADDKLKIKYSTLIGGPTAIVWGGTGTIDIAMYSCALNITPSPSDINNTIGASNNTIDAGIDF